LIYDPRGERTRHNIAALADSIDAFLIERTGGIDRAVEFLIVPIRFN